MTTIEFKVEGVSCGLCVKTIEGALNEIGIQGKVDLESATLAVTCDESVAPLEKIKEVVEVYGYIVIQK